MRNWATDLGMTEAAVKSAVQRMRQRHRELLREEIAHTVTRPEEIEEELRHFRALLGRGTLADPELFDYFFGTFGRFFVPVVRQMVSASASERKMKHARHQSLRGVRDAFAGLLAQGPVRPVRA